MCIEAICLGPVDGLGLDLIQKLPRLVIELGTVSSDIVPFPPPIVRS